MNPACHKPSILAVDDAASNIDVLVDLLEAPYDVLVALDGPSALEMVQEEEVDLILLDIMMPGMSGYDVCRRLKADPRLRDVPVIFLTAKSDEASIEQAYAVGGIDYVTKPFKQVELLARIRTQLDLRRLVKDLEFLASSDSLTGIYNRRRFFELATERFERGDDVCAAMIDIDNFKAINDSHGHAVGDQVITQVAHLIRAQLGDEMFVGRLGGEEFAILAPLWNPGEFFALVERIRQAVADLRIPAPDTPPQVRVSIGLACRSADMRSIDALLLEADEALYRAKVAGKNRTVRRRE